MILRQNKGRVFSHTFWLFSSREISTYISGRLSQALTLEELQYCLDMYNSSTAKRMRRQGSERSQLGSSQEFLSALPGIRKAYKPPERLALMARLDHASLLRETAENKMVLTQASYVLSVKGALSWTAVSVPEILEKADEKREEFQEALDLFWGELVWYLFRNIGDEDLAVWVEVEESAPMQKDNRVFVDALQEACLNSLHKAGRRIGEGRDLPGPPTRRRYPRR